MRTTVYIDSQSPCIFRGINWSDDHPQDPETSKFSQGTFWSTQQEDTISFDMQAAIIDVYGSKAFNHGNYEAKVYVPNTLQNPGVTEAFSGKTTDRDFQTMIYSYDFDAGDQDNSVNKVRLGNKGAAGDFFDLDFIVATIKVGADDEPINTKTYGDADPEIKYSGTWKKGTIPNRSTTWSTENGASFTISFQGSSIAVYGLTDRKNGQYKVSLDGGQEITYNGTSSARYFDTVQFVAAHLDQTKPHTLKLTNAGSGDKSLFELQSVVVNSTSVIDPPTAPQNGGYVQTISAGASSSATVSSVYSSTSSDSSTPTIVTTATNTTVGQGAGAIATSASQVSISTSLEIETSVVKTDGTLQTITKIRTHSSTPTPPNTGKEAANNSTDSSNTTRTGAIVGGALGAVVLSCLVIVLLVCLRRKRRRERTTRRTEGAASMSRGTSSFVGYGSPTSDFGVGQGRKLGMSGEKTPAHDDHVFLPYLGGLKSRQGSPAPPSRAETPQFYPFIAMGGGTNTTTTSVPREFVTGERFTPTREMDRMTPTTFDGRDSITSSQGRELVGATIQNAQRRSLHIGERPTLKLDPLTSTFVSTNTSSGFGTGQARSTPLVSAYPSSSTSPVLRDERPLSDTSSIEEKLNRFTASALMSPAARSSYLTSTSKHHAESSHPYSAAQSSTSFWSSQPSGATPLNLNKANKRAVSGPLSAVSSISPLTIPGVGESPRQVDTRASDATLVSMGATNGASTRGGGTPNSLSKSPRAGLGVPGVPSVPEIYRSASSGNQADPPSSARLRKLAEAEQLVRGVGLGGRDGLESDDEVEDDDETRRTRPPGYYSRHFPSPE